jgi:hypothetical protein
MPLFGRSSAQDADAARATVVCPSCHEPAPAEPLICPHCKGALPPRPQATESGSTGSAAAVATMSADQASPPAEPTANPTPAASSVAWCPQCGTEYDDAAALRRHAELAHPAR